MVYHQRLLILLLLPATILGNCLYVDNSSDAPCVPKSPVTARLHRLLRSVTTSTDPITTRNSFTSAAIRAAESSNLQGAVANFRAAAFYKPGEAQMNSNLALALRDTALSLLNKQHKKSKTKKIAWRMLCEAVAAYELVFYLKNKPIANQGQMRDTYALLQHVHNLLDSNFPGRCHSVGNCKRYEILKRGMNLELLEPTKSSSSSSSFTTSSEILSSSGDVDDDDNSVDYAEIQRQRHVEAVNLVCASENMLVVKLEESDRKRGTPSIFFARRVYATMRICGAVTVPDVWSKEQLEPVVQAQRQVLNDFISHGDRSGARGGNQNSDGGKIDGDDDDDEFENSKAATRSKSRFEIKLPLAVPFTSNGFADNRWLVYVLKLIMSEKILIDTFSFVTSLSGAPDQHWHNDVSGLFTSQGPRTSHLPPQSLVAVIPFDAMNSTTGPTEHRLGSHVQMGGGYWEKRDHVDDAKDGNTPKARIEAKVGDVVLFDVRLRHHGTANNSPNQRSIAYIGYGQSWWMDDVNFKGKQTRRWDRIPSKTRRQLFQRIDGHDYTAMLEDMIEEKIKGGKEMLKELKSKGEYSQVQMVVV